MTSQIITSGIYFAAIAQSAHQQYCGREQTCLDSYLLRNLSSRTFFGISAMLIIAAMLMLGFSSHKTVLYIAIAMVGFGNSNIFSIIFASALQSLPNKKNEVSGLMIMGLFGGTIFPMAMGIAADAAGQLGAVIVMGIGAAYLLFYTTHVKQ